MSDNSLPRINRPHFYEDGSSDQLFSIVTALAAELAVVRERARTLELILEANNIIPADAIEEYSPTDAQQDQRAARQKDFVTRVFAILDTERKDMA